MTPSTSSSSTNPSQGQSSQLYTTAGTVYNPSAAIPLQPPTRKGRASRWPPPSQADFALLNKSAPPGYPYRRSPPTTASSLKHYSPLQQNSDRAVEPSPVPNNLNRSISDSSSLSFNASNLHGTVTGLDRDENSDRLRNMGLQFEDKEEDELVRTSYFNKLGVKALTNLASYPNLHQRMAQRALDKARETVKAAETSRTMSPPSFRQGFQPQQEANGVLLASTNFSRDLGNAYGRTSRTENMVGSTRSSVLSNGPGAPRPLTAGPPGQRQYRAATLDGALRAPQSNIPQPSTIDETHFDITPPLMVNFDRLTTTSIPCRSQSPYQAEQLPVRSNTDFGRPLLHNAFTSVHPPDTARRPSRTRDTLPVDHLRQYFHQGFPSDYHYDPDSIIPFPPNGADLRLQEGRYLPTPEEVRLKNARSKAAFYSSTGELLKTLDERITDARGKLQDMELGINKTPEQSGLAEIDRVHNSTRLGKPNHEFTIDFVNELPTHEAATPLVNMAFSTLLNYWDNGRLMTGIPTGFQRIEDHEFRLRDQTMNGGNKLPNSSRVRRRCY